MSEKSHRIPSLDGLRAISIFLVVISHLLYTRDFAIAHSIVDKWIPHLGALGVRTFFVISGFLITNLLVRELDVKNSIHLTKFYFRRTFRIFPPYYFYLLVIMLLYLVNWISLVSGDTLHAFTYTINYHRARSWSIGHGWSLSVEEQFYLLWPATMLLLGKRRGLWIACSLVVLCPVIRLGYYYFVPGLIRYEVDYRFETVADSLAIGCALAIIHEWLMGQRLSRVILDSRLFALVPIIVFCANSLNERTRLGLFCYVSVQNVGIAACILWCVTNYSGRIGKVLNAKPVVFIGVMSYSIYLWQQLILLNRESSSIITHFPLNFVLLCIASLVSYYCVERPSLDLRQRLERRIFSPQQVEKRARALAADPSVSGSTLFSGNPGSQSTTVRRSESIIDVAAQTERGLNAGQET